MNFEKYYLLDTNILLEDARNIFKLSDGAKNLIILSETVLDAKIGLNRTTMQELDRTQKRSLTGQ